MIVILKYIFWRRKISTAIAGSITHLGNFHDSSYGGSEGKKLWNDIIESVHTEIQNRINSLEFYQVIGGNEFIKRFF